jgi:DNA polymerase I
MTGKKRNTPPFIKKAFKETTDILKKIENMDDFNKSKKEIITHIKSYYKQIGKPPEKGGFQLYDYAITIGIKKNLKDYTKNVPQHIKAAKMEKNALGTNYTQGDTIEIIKSASKEGVKPFKLAKIQDVDIKKYKELLEATFDQLLDALNTSFEEIKGAQKLDSFL